MKEAGMKMITWKRVLAGSLVLNVTLVIALSGDQSWVRDSRADVTPAGAELSPYMALMQHHLHKLGLALQAKNAPLAGFYLEEVEETATIIQKQFPTYDKIAVGPLMSAMLVPAIAPLEKSIKASNWPISNAGYTKLIDSCNGCHAAAQHGFVKITAPTQNPFNQSFSPQ
jgi:hypothetical protein